MAGRFVHTVSVGHRMRKGNRGRLVGESCGIGHTIDVESVVSAPTEGTAAAELNPRTLFVNSSVALIVAMAITIVLHEMAHWFTGTALGYRSTLYPFGVDHGPDIAGVPAAITAMAGPVLSLIVGPIMIVAQPIPVRAGFWHLVWLLVGFTSAMEGISYFALTPMGVGDTGATMRYLNLPVWLGFVALAVSIAGMLFLARWFATYLVRYTGRQMGVMWALGFWPWVLNGLVSGALAVTYLSLSATEVAAGDTVAIIINSFGMASFMPMAFMFARRVDSAYRPLALRRIPVAGLIALAAVIVVNLMLTRGFAIG